MEMDRDTFSEVFMIPLSTAISSGLTWSTLARNRSYELKLKGEVVGTLQRSGFWSSSFVAETHDGRWTFRRGGFFGTFVEVIDSVSGQQVASFKAGYGRGVLAFADGQRFDFACNGWWRPVWTVMTGSGQTMVRLQAREKTVDLPSSAAGATEGVATDGRLSLLILFLWYRVLQAEEDAASAAVMAAVS
jgi:hypothetical protein